MHFFQLEIPRKKRDILSEKRESGMVLKKLEFTPESASVDTYVQINVTCPLQKNYSTHELWNSCHENLNAYYIGHSPISNTNYFMVINEENNNLYKYNLYNQRPLLA